MQTDTARQDGRRQWFGVLLLGMLLLGVIAFAWPLVKIPLRLSRNGAVANRLVEYLQTRFPGISFQGGPSYEREIIYINVSGRVDETIRRDVEQWLRDQKAEQRIEPEIWLRFLDDSDAASDIRI